MSDNELLKPTDTQELVFYTSEDGTVNIAVHLVKDSVWLSLKEITQLFGRDKSVIARHINNIFKIKELDKNSVVAKYATTAADGKIYQVDYYNLDMIISVGYRVNSKQGVQFRQWATRTLKEYLIRGYSMDEKRLAETGLRDLQETVTLLQRTLVHHQLVDDLGSEVLHIITHYAKTWRLLLAYDENRLEMPTQGKIVSPILNYHYAKDAIGKLKEDLMTHKEASPLFGQEREKALESIFQNLEQTYGGQTLYKSIEEKAAHLLYFIIKDHPFVDGNKRIGSFLFLLYLDVHTIPFQLNDKGLVALALLIAESNPIQKETMIRLTVNFLMESNT